MVIEGNRTATSLPVAQSSDRSFGFVFAGFFTLVALFPVISGNPVRLWALGVGAVFLFLALIKPDVLHPLNNLWTKFGLVLHKITSGIALFIVFFGVVTPIGVLMRLSGKDPMRLKRDPQATTYWQERMPAGPDPETLKHQF